MTKGDPIRLGLMGAGGRMGAMVARLLAETYAGQARLAAVWGRGEGASPLLGCDAIIDFSSPEGTLALLEAATPGALPPLACGTTGWKTESRAQLKRLCRDHRVLWSANFSTGIAVLEQMLKQWAPLLIRLGYTPVITETHHRHKKDAPSGTAKTLRRAICPDHPDSVQTHSIRVGEVVGEHRVQFHGVSDQIEWLHRAQDRTAFARGAIDAALWLAHGPRTPGLLGMEDWFRELRARSGREKEESP